MFGTARSTFNLRKQASAAVRTVAARLREQPKLTPTFHITAVGVWPEGSSGKMITKILYDAGLDSGATFSAGAYFLFCEAHRGALSRMHQVKIVRERHFGKHVKRTEELFDPNMRVSELLKRPTDAVFVRIEPKKAVHA